MEDARESARAGAHYVGAVHVPSSPRCVEVELARELGREAGVPLVLVVAGLEAGEVIRKAQEAEAGVVQLHGGEGPELVRIVREGGPWKVWVAVSVRGPARLRERLQELGPEVDGVLLDTWDRERLGGTGRTFAWDAGARVREMLPQGTLLAVAGGLRPGNVRAATEALRPDVVDVSSGVEAEPRRKDVEKIRSFVREVRRSGGGLG